MSSQSQFSEMLADIEPSPTTVSLASSAQRTLRKYLAEDPEFSNVHIDTYLAGSYARDTSIRPRLIDGKLCKPDVDIIVVTNHTSADDPADVIQELLDCLEKDYEIQNPDNDRSVGVATAAVKMDVVPVINGAPGDLNPFYIPDRRLGQWIEDHAADQPYGGIDDEGQVLIACDADVGVIADHATRYALDILAERTPSRFPYSLYLIGLTRAWVFSAPFHTIPIATPAPTPTEAKSGPSQDEERAGLDLIAELLQDDTNETSTTA